MRLARINDGFKLRVGQQAVGDDVQPAGAADRTGLGGATEAMAADCTSLVGCG